MKVAFGPFTFDSDTRELVEAGARVHLSPKAFDLLRLLLELRPAVVSKRVLLDHIWPGTFVSEASLSVVVSEARQVLRDDSRQSQFIRTVHRIGYAFSGEVQVLSRAPHDTAPPDHQPCWLTHDERSLALGAGENVVGRDPRCAVWVDVSGVSRRHARIDVGPAGAMIADLASRNGTFVAGERVTSPRPLADGEVIELGAATLVFRVWSDARAPQTERISRP